MTLYDRFIVGMLLGAVWIAAVFGFAYPLSTGLLEVAFEYLGLFCVVIGAIPVVAAVGRSPMRGWCAIADSTSADVKGLAAWDAKARSESLLANGRAAATVSTQLSTSMQGRRVSAARAGSAELNSASFMLAGPLVRICWHPW